jgi:hypothetical protein
MQEILFNDTVALGRSDPTYCGARSYSLSTEYGFLSISGTTLTLSTDNIGDAKTYNLNITVGLVDYSNVA